MTDKATPTLRQRCDTALQSLPDAPYKTMLAVLFDDMTAEIERLAAQSAPTDYPSCSGNPSSCPENEGHGCCNAVAQSAPTVLSEDLTLAAVNCQHQIDADCIRLWRDEKKEGSALSQLVDRVVAVIEQSTAQPQAVVPADQRPVNCGTGYCSCIECVVEPTAQAERAPVVQAVPDSVKFICVDCTGCEKCRASSGATTQAVRMLTPREIELLREIRLHAQFGLNEGWQREARNLLLELEQYYRTIPPSGEIGGA